MAAAESEQQEVPLFEVDPNKDVSYINLTILDASKTIETTVKEKLEEKSQSSRFRVVRRILSRELVQNKIADVASKKVKPSLIAGKLSETMPKLLMYKIDQEIGMKVAARTVFQQDAYVVIEFQIKYVDAGKLYAKLKEGPPKEGQDTDLEIDPEIIDAWMKEQEAAPIETNDDAPASDGDAAEEAATTGTQTWTQWLMSPLSSATEFVTESLGAVADKVESDTLPSVVQGKITEQMGAMMEAKLSEKLLDAEIAVLPGEEQARYFYANIEAVQNRKDGEE